MSTTALKKYIEQDDMNQIKGYLDRGDIIMVVQHNRTKVGDRELLRLVNSLAVRPAHNGLSVYDASVKVAGYRNVSVLHFGANENGEPELINYQTHDIVEEGWHE